MKLLHFAALSTAPPSCHSPLCRGPPLCLFKATRQRHHRETQGHPASLCLSLRCSCMSDILRTFQTSILLGELWSTGKEMHVPNSSLKRSRMFHRIQRWETSAKSAPLSSSTIRLFLHTTHHDCAKMAVMILGFLGLSILDAVSVNLLWTSVSYVPLWFSYPRPCHLLQLPSGRAEGWK